jgi:tetratricopeptide (TPR) repeat protein
MRLTTLSTLFLVIALGSSARGQLTPAPAATASPSAAADSAATESPVAGTAPTPVADAAPADDVIIPERLLDRTPFDRIVLNAENQNAIIETVLLDLPDRQLPSPLPREGSLELHMLSQPSIPYALAWASIARIELYEQILLDEAKRLTASGEFAEAFDYYAFLEANYPRLAGLDAALDDYLWRDAAAAFSAGDGAAAWPALLALYERNPAYPRLVNAVQAVSDALISADLSVSNYAAARAELDVVEKHFPKLELTNIARWRQRLSSDAEAKLRTARAAFNTGNFHAAREAAMIAEAIAPELDEARTLLAEIQAAAPEFRVGVMQAGAPQQPTATPDWAAARVADLVNPQLARVVAFGSEGGVYDCSYGVVTNSESGLETSLRLSPAARRRGLSADVIALRFVELANLASADVRDELAAALVSIDVADGSDVKLVWRQPHLHPEALLQIPIRGLTTNGDAGGLWFQATRPRASVDGLTEISFERTGMADSNTGSNTGAPRFVVERVYDDDSVQLGALARGELDAVDRVPPWLLEQARRTPGVAVKPYALPTVHVLIPNFDNPLLATREFRRALCYAIDSRSIVRDILLGGNDVAGFTPISGPFPAGSSLTDPVGYAYNSELKPRPYEPRLAALLSGVARATLVKRDLEERKARGEEIEAEDPTKEPTLPPPEELVLVHPADALARVACQALKLQLDNVGIPVKLVEAPVGQSPADMEYDLLYAELAVWEPLTDARRLLGRTGLTGRASALMSTALDELDASQNWNEARTRLKAIHRIAYYDLPVIPLWQTLNHYAHRNWLAGMGERPLTLYQNLDDWRKDFGGGTLGGPP